MTSIVAYPTRQEGEALARYGLCLVVVRGAVDVGNPTRARKRDGETEVIVCSCNVLSDSAIRRTIADGGDGARIAEVFCGLGCRAQCGRCVPTIRRLIRESCTEDDATCPAMIDEGGRCAEPLLAAAE